ncbi:MAG: DUF1285 domain-containing protein [Halioglobus sp.]|nr:DUF1285 domain-containing protein [Halioglobus sp.]
MADSLEGIEKQIKRRSFDAPPIHLWHPALSGDIDIRIAADGAWYHEGTVIQRDSLVRLFASILRREEDGEYYLVTPAEKWRIKVDLHPLIVTEVNEVTQAGSPGLQATLNTGRTLLIDAGHPLFLEPVVGDIPVLQLDHGLTALFSRPAWYRLADRAQELEGVPVITSGDYTFELTPQQT